MGLLEKRMNFDLNILRDGLIVVAEKEDFGTVYSKASLDTGYLVA